MIKNILSMSLVLLFLFACGEKNEKVYYAKDFGIVPNTGEDMTKKIAKVIALIKSECGDAPACLEFEGGEYDFYPDSAIVRELYISNHDQDNPKHVAVLLEGMKNFTLKSAMNGHDARRADFFMNGRMLPIAMLNCENCKIYGIGIDTRAPQITQVEIIENDTADGFITYRIAPYVNYRVVNGRLVVYGSNWEFCPTWGIAFDGESRHLVYCTSDIAVGVNNIEEVAPRVIRAPWRDARLLPGTIVAMRSYHRPTPGILLSGCKNTEILRSVVYYAEGMGLLAQVCENIVLNGFMVTTRSNERYFTTQADATHFSGCKGIIKSEKGVYEGMMDDAINVHGTYLRVVKRLSDNVVVGRYMHPQAYGFYWGGEGDSVQFVKSSTMELVGGNFIEKIEPYDTPSIDGAKEFKITLRDNVSGDIDNGDYGIENLEWTPSVYFADNIVRNNRARGALFSTPKDVVVENNFFDHTSGTAILLCGDCNGWFETGACRNVVIRKNRFLNSLTNMFQFTNGIISIYPEIPQLQNQEKYFHGGNGAGVVIEDNVFETFDAPIVYAKSLDGFVFRGNKILQNNDYKPFHWNKKRFLFDRVKNVFFENNEFSTGFDSENDVEYRY